MRTEPYIQVMKREDRNETNLINTVHTLQQGYNNPSLAVTGITEELLSYAIIAERVEDYIARINKISVKPRIGGDAREWLSVFRSRNIQNQITDFWHGIVNSKKNVGVNLEKAYRPLFDVLEERIEEAEGRLAQRNVELGGLAA